MLKQELQQKLLQRLSPQQIQMIKLLEIPTAQLEQRIKKELEENPVLEEGNDEDYDEYQSAEEEFDQEQDGESSKEDEFSMEDYYEEDEYIPAYKLNAQNYSKDDKKTEMPYSAGSSFHDHLENQLGLRDLSEREYNLGLYLLGNIDEDGYVRRDISAIVDDLAFSQNVETSEEELEKILMVIQDFEPVGVGARNLRECLLLQIDNKDTTHDSIRHARDILKHHFNEFTKKHYEKIKERLKLSEEEMKEAIEEILHLNPKPGSSYGDEQSKNIEQIIPDFILESKDGELQISLNAKNVPDLKLNQTYMDMIQGIEKQKQKPDKKQKETFSFVKQKLDSAKWFIDAVKQRQNTLMVTMQAIVNYQYEYFQQGDETKLKPMILKDIAEVTGLDISTISRVVNSKYVQTNFGIFPLKYFFSEGIMKEGGEEVSTREIKSIMSELINNEDKHKPLTDEKLADILKEKGYHIARRTVAKYREQLGLPVARLRKEL